MTAVVRVASCQVRLDIDDPSGSHDRLDESIDTAVSGGADLIVLPELATSGYVFRDADEARGLAETLDGPSVNGWRDRSRYNGITIVSGFCELDAEGRLRNSAVVISDGEVLALYRKAHLWDGEKAIFVPGDEPPCVVDTPAGRLGVMICYDLEFPEWCRLPALGGAQLLVAPTNWPLASAPDAERPMEVVRAQATASVNGVFVVTADRCGAERGVDWVGGSAIIGPDGFPLAGPARPDESTVLFADVDPSAADDKTIGPWNDVLADRRPDLYGFR